MLLKNMTMKSLAISLGALAIPILILWIIPLEQGTPQGDFLRGLRMGMTTATVGIILGVGVYRLVKGKWPNKRADERDRMIASKAGEAAFYVIAILTMLCAVILPVAFPVLTIRASILAVILLFGVSLIYLLCRIGAEIRH